MITGLTTPVATNTTVQLFTDNIKTLFNSYRAEFTFTNGTLVANVVGASQYFAFSFNISAAAVTGLVEDSFIDIVINGTDTFTFGAQKYTAASNPSGVVYNCSKVFELEDGDELEFYLTTVCTAPSVNITAYIYTHLHCHKKSV